MSQNNEFKDFVNFNLGSPDLNSWCLYQQPFLNVSHCNVLHNEFYWSYPNNCETNNPYNQYYLTNPVDNFNNSPNFVNNRQYKNETSKINHFKESRSKVDQKLTLNESLKRDKGEIMTKPLSKVIDSIPYKKKEQQFKILSRNNQSETSLIKSIEKFPDRLNIDNDFPPILDNLKNPASKIINKNEKTLDFKLALQKPKIISETKSIIKSEINEDENNNEKAKKKRKRRRKKKVQLEEVKTIETFEYIDEEFPTLDIMTNNLSNDKNKLNNEKKEKPVADEEVLNNDSDKKTRRRRQLLFILPKDLEGQVKIVEAKSIKKSQIKRKVYQDRMRKPMSILNPLDLSGPTVKRGKERLVPKIKKPSKIKKNILLCRSKKKELRDAFKNITLPINDGDNENDIIVKVQQNEPDNSLSKIHSKNFREYCNHMIGNNINSMISTLLKTLINFQDKLFNRDPIKAKMKRRLCFGLREVTKFVNMKKLRLILIAPDLEKVDIQGGLDDIVFDIIKVARESSIPCIFGLNRGSLAYICFKKFRVGAIGVFNYDGAENQVKELLKAVDEARDQYNQVKQIMQSITHDVSIASELIDPQLQSNNDTDQQNNCVYVGHSRTPSNALSEPISEIIEVNKPNFIPIFVDQNHHTMISKTLNVELNEDVEDNLIESYVEDILNSVSKLNLEI